MSRESKAPLVRAASAVLVALLGAWALAVGLVLLVLSGLPDHLARRARPARPGLAEVPGFRDHPAHGVRAVPSAPRAIRDPSARPDRGEPLARQEYPDPEGLPEHLAARVRRALRAQ